MPKRLKKFPLWMGKYPIFFTVSRNKDGSPNFRVKSRDREVQCANQNLCAICGERMLDGVFWFIAARMEIEHGGTIDGAMHEECARYAAATCPFLSSLAYITNHRKPSKTPQLLVSTNRYKTDVSKQVIVWKLGDILTSEVIDPRGDFRKI